MPKEFVVVRRSDRKVNSWLNWIFENHSGEIELEELTKILVTRFQHLPVTVVKKDEPAFLVYQGGGYIIYPVIGGRVYQRNPIYN